MPLVGAGDTSAVITGLTNNTDYYWRVNATNAGGAGPWSNTANFTVIPLAPGMPSIVSPVAGAVNIPVNVSVVWHKVPTAATYRLQVSTSTGFTSMVKDTSGLADTSFSLTGLSNNTVF